MSMNVTLYHNPRCSKSRQTLQLLEEKALAPRIVEYLKEPPDRKTLEQVLAQLGMSPRELMRKTESIYKELNLADAALSDDELITAMLEHPILIERPIVIVDGQKAALGRPPENVLRILED